MDVAAGTLQTYRVALGRILPRFGEHVRRQRRSSGGCRARRRPPREGLKKQTIRKTVSVLAMVLDHARIEPNPAARSADGQAPARGTSARRAAYRGAHPGGRPAASERYQLPVLVLDATGMRVGELEALLWGDVDEPRSRWRIATSKTGRPRWVDASCASVRCRARAVPARRSPTRPPRIREVTSERLRTALTRACTAAGTPAFSPHDLRHRRVSLLHLGGMPWARIGELVGPRRSRNHGPDVHACRRRRARARLCGVARLTSAEWGELLKLLANRLHLLPVLLVHREPPYLVAKLRAVPPAPASGRLPIA